MSKGRAFLIGLGGLFLVAQVAIKTPHGWTPHPRYPSARELCPSSNHSGYCVALRWQLAGMPATSPPHPARPDERWKLYNPQFPADRSSGTSSARTRTVYRYVYRTSRQPFKSAPFRPTSSASATSPQRFAQPKPLRANPAPSFSVTPAPFHP
jgi:hypothetical protein